MKLPKHIELIQYEQRKQQVDTLTTQVTQQLQHALEYSSQAVLAVPGGTTPGTFLSHLSQQTLDWNKVIISLTDERQVPADHERSNALLLRNTLFQHQASQAQFIELFTKEHGISNNAMLEALRPLDVCILGMGTDGHTASLFPQAQQLTQALQRDNTDIACAIQAPGASEPRISLTLATLLSAKHTHILIHGQEKLTVLHQAIDNLDDIEDMPIRAIFKYAQQVTIHYAD